MESQPQNPQFRNNPENLHPCINLVTQLLILILNHGDQIKSCNITRLKDI